MARAEWKSLRLTQFSNFAIRALMYAALNGSTPSAVPEIARAYGVSYDHLKKVAAELCRLGYLETVRGRNGGFRLAKDPREIRIGDVIRQTEREGDWSSASIRRPTRARCCQHASCASLYRRLSPPFTTFSIGTPWPT